ncbi:YhhN-like protein [Zychaea mexicana]|uniref:YhhN-like protein n=1 Tax=Zychaea mexicana TaxID=64656 RepID=UPI0022FE26DC|nr:YhhN-like protein [Zychaea mexicana]KAI9497231.1 YhhN-like protein [Zychaea mexicana]
MIQETFAINQGVKLTAAALPLLLASEYYQSRKGVWVFKPLASLGFLLSATANHQGTAALPVFSKYILLGLGLGAVGDVCLIPKSGFLLGLGSFLVGHLSLVYAFTVHGMDASYALAGLAGTGAIGTIVGRWLLPKVKDPVMRKAVLGYMLVITGMVVTATASLPHTPVPRQQYMGALMFYLSDLFVARQEFVTKSVWNSWIGLPLYYGGQLLLAGTLAQ